MLKWKFTYLGGKGWVCVGSEWFVAKMVQNIFPVFSIRCIWSVFNNGGWLLNINVALLMFLILIPKIKRIIEKFLLEIEGRIFDKGCSGWRLLLHEFMLKPWNTLRFSIDFPWYMENALGWQMWCYSLGKLTFWYSKSDTIAFIPRI